MMHGSRERTSSCDSSQRATRAVVDLGAIRHNVRLVRAAVGPGVRLMAMVKANAYGHGAVPVARACVEAGATGLAVAAVDEGLALRRSGITAPLLVLGASAPEEHPEALRHDLTLAVGSLRMADNVAAAARATGVTARVHVEVDTGLSRFGVPAARAVEEISALAVLPGLEVEGIYTHFAAAEEPDRRSARAQLALFTGLLEALAARDVRVPLRHAANSAAILELPEAHLDLVRPGIALYGYHPAGSGADPRDLRPALTLVSTLARVEAMPAGTGVSYNHTFRTTRASVLGLVPLGFADGLPRLLSNRGHMLVRGRRCPIVGRVCMDQTVLDVTNVPGARVGEPVVVLGCQGAERIGADEIGLHAGTNAYETLCRIGPRVPRDYCGRLSPHGGARHVVAEGA
jgi:alanine racemase